MKKRMLALAVLVICLSILASTTFAYFTDIGTARNVITSGAVEIQVVEQQLVDGTLQPYPNQPIPVMPATAASKIVSVQSTEQAAWVRMNYVITIYDAEDKKMQISADKLKNMVVIDPDSKNWTEKDGWWYYSTALKSGEKSSPLFERVYFSGVDMGNEYQGCTVVIDVTAQAVQQANNGSTVMEAAGWPEE